jgi:hypothetical protein
MIMPIGTPHKFSIMDYQLSFLLKLTEIRRKDDSPSNNSTGNAPTRPKHLPINSVWRPIGGSVQQTWCTRREATKTHCALLYPEEKVESLSKNAVSKRLKNAS